jgi:hypothetical protein
MHKAGAFQGAKAYFYEHSELARAQHTNGPRDMPWCGALSLLQKLLHFRGGQKKSCPALSMWDLAQLLLAPAFNSRGNWPWCPGRCSLRRSLCVAGTCSWCPGAARFLLRVLGRSSQRRISQVLPRSEPRRCRSRRRILRQFYNGAE